MGFRFRKSINMGPLRVNLSKSGIGYSVGGKGARYTKTANGKTRTTLNIPGTGLSYVEETGKRKDKKMFNKPEFTPISPDSIEVPQDWITNKLGLTPKESELFMAVVQFGNQPFTPRDIAATGCAVSSSIYTNLYNKNVLNKNEDKTWSLNCAFINQVSKQYQTQRAQYLNKLNEPKGHSLILHILFGGFVFWIPAIYITYSKNHYWHL